MLILACWNKKTKSWRTWPSVKSAWTRRCPLCSCPVVTLSPALNVPPPSPSAPSVGRASRAQSEPTLSRKTPSNPTLLIKITQKPILRRREINLWRKTKLGNDYKLPMSNRWSLILLGLFIEETETKNRNIGISFPDDSIPFNIIQRCHNGSSYIKTLKNKDLKRFYRFDKLSGEYFDAITGLQFIDILCL